MRTLLIAATGVATLLGSPAFGQTLYRYVDSNGAVQYSDKPLMESTGRSIERMSRSGTHLSDKPGAAKIGGRPAADVATPHQKEDSVAKTEQRRNLALLATYNSLKEIDDAQTYALRDAKQELRDAQARMVETGRRREQLQAQVNSQGDKASSELKEKLATAEFEFKSLAALVEAKRRDVQSINERYEEDRRRYTQLLGKGSPDARN